MRFILMGVMVLCVSLPLLAAEDANSGKEVPDVQTIVNKANIVAYYQGDDGKATVKMVITSKQGQKREREFNILRKDVEDGGDLVAALPPATNTPWSMFEDDITMRVIFSPDFSISRTLVSLSMISASLLLLSSARKL